MLDKYVKKQLLPHGETFLLYTTSTTVILCLKLRLLAKKSSTTVAWFHDGQLMFSPETFIFNCPLDA